MADEHFSRTFFLAALFGLLVVTLIFLSHLITAIIAGAILAYLTYPIYKFISKKIGSKQLAAGIIVFILVILTTIPPYFIAQSLTKEGYSLFITAKQKLATGELQIQDCAANPQPFCEVMNKFITLIKNPQFKYYVEDAISKIASYVVNKTTDLIANIPGLIIDFVVMFFMIYYFLIDGTTFIDKIRRSIPLKSHHIDHIINQFDNFTYATIYGNFITAIVQGTIGGLIFWILGISTPLLAGLAMAFFAFLPFIGTPIVWIPAVISLFIMGETGKAVILLLLGIFVISTIDNIIKPEIIGKRTNLHPAAVLIGIIGGMFTMGIIGILVGPLVISLLVSFVEVYYKEGY
jgi:predicted PurR-regulated permease PerM